jgi:hypothetical protein
MVMQIQLGELDAVYFIYLRFQISECEISFPAHKVRVHGGVKLDVASGHVT